MSREQHIAEFIVEANVEDFSPAARNVVKQIFLTVIGAGLAGAFEDGCDAIRNHVLDFGGRKDATVFFSGDKAPAHLAAMANGYVCRALDYCEGMEPGLHVGSSIVPAALALAEKVGGCTGRDLYNALAVGAEVGARFNLSEAEYHGFDPTGVAGVFATTATAARIKKLSKKDTLHALALAFNRAGASFQSNVDGSLAVRLIQGWVAESGIVCADMAGIGITGPVNFLDGVYGFKRLFASETDNFIAGLGQRFFCERAMFKQFPSCGLTQGSTQLILEAMRKHSITANQIKAIDVKVPPYAHKLVGHQFAVGKNPRVNAQFNIQFCVANALLHGSSKLSHFAPESVVSEMTSALIKKIVVYPDAELDVRGHTAVDLDIELASGQRVQVSLDHPDGFPDRPLATEAHIRRFNDCLAYSQLDDVCARGSVILNLISDLESVPDVRLICNQLAAK